MRKLFNLILMTILMSVTSLMMVSCDDSAANRPTISKSTLSTDDEESELTEEEIEAARLEALARPDGAVTINSDFCACQNNEPVILGNCTNFCATKSTADPILYINVDVTAAISERTDLGTFYNWCTKEIVDPETGEAIATNPNCMLELKDSDGNVGYLNFSSGPTNGSKALQVNISTIDYDKTYRIRIVETTSTAGSSTVQIRKKSTPITDPVGGPLWTTPVHQYTCMNLTISDDGVSLFYEAANRIHFYFNEENRPDPLSSSFVNIYCHDKTTYGSTPINSPLLEESVGSYTLWNVWDPRFWDTDGDGTPQINQLIQQAVVDQGYTLSEAPNLFHKFQWYNGPNASSTSSTTDSGTASQATLGYYMTPWIDQSTFKAFCPKAAHYESSNQLFVAMKDLVGVDTEGLYIAQQEGGNDFILVREALIKQIWFYTENGQNIQPNDNTITGKKVQFYWPADTSSPYIRKSHQTTYTVKLASEVGNDNVSTDVSSSSGSASSYPPHDKRIGCVPAL